MQESFLHHVCAVYIWHTTFSCRSLYLCSVYTRYPNSTEDRQVDCRESKIIMNSVCTTRTSDFSRHPQLSGEVRDLVLSDTHILQLQSALLRGLRSREAWTWRLGTSTSTKRVPLWLYTTAEARNPYSRRFVRACRLHWACPLGVNSRAKRGDTMAWSPPRTGV